MKISSMPSLVAVPFADQGTKNTIPVDSQIGVKDGAASYTDGFPPLTMTPVVAGGIPPAGGDFNGILNAITQSLRWACAGGQYKYDSAFSAAVGGYPKGAMLQNDAGDILWLNTLDDNTANPDAGPGWIPAIRYGLTSLALTGTAVTLTPAQAAKETIVLTGTLTANVQLIMPAWVETWLIVNNTTGSFVVSVKTSAGNGVNIAAGSSSQVYGDGTNIYYGALLVRNNLAEIKAAGSNSQAAARDNLGLKSAATHDVTTSNADSTAERVLRVGDWGLGGAPRQVTIGNETVASFWRDTAAFKSGITIPFDGTPTLNFFAIDSANPNAYIGRKSGAGAITWTKLYSEYNKPDAADVDAVSASQGGTFAKGVTFNQGLSSKGRITWGDYSHPVGDAAYNAMMSVYDSGGKIRWSFGPYLNTWSIYSYNYDGSFDANLLNIDFTTHNAKFIKEVIPGDYGNFDARYARSPNDAGWGGVGTYAFLSCNTAQSNGSTVAGSALYASGVGGQKSAVGWGDKSIIQQGSTMAGTWKCCGNQPAQDGSDVGATLYYRIS